MSILLGFGHRKQSGKDTAVASILKAFGGKYHIERAAFADELKREYVQMCEEAGGTFEMMEGAKVRYGTPDWVYYEFGTDTSDPICGKWGKQRRFLQWWGEYRRSQDQWYWVKKLAQNLNKVSPQFALISDMRYKNEAAWVKSCGGYTVKVTRLGMVSTDNHISEHDLDDYPFDFELMGADGNKELMESTAVGFFDWLVKTLDPSPVSLVGGANAFRIA